MPSMKKRGVVIFWALLSALAAIRVAGSFYVTAPDIGECAGKTVQGVARLVEEPALTDTGQTFVAEADDICGSQILIRMKTKLYPRFAYGDHISFSGKISEPRNFKSDGGRTFDYVGYLAKDDVYYEIRSVTADIITDDAGGFSIPSALLSLRRHFVAHLNSALGDPQAALGAGLVVGEKSALGKGLLDDFRTVGLIHIVVLSGFNITVVAAALRRILSFLPRAVGIVIGGIGIALFGILVGGGATVVRSCFMASIALTGDLIRRDYSVHRALAFAALVMLIQSPMILLHDPSFQLSFLATVGLIALATPIENRLGWIPDIFGMRGTVAATAATQIFVSPYILYMMGQLSIIGVVVNILVLPFIPVTMLAVFLTGLAGFIWPVAAVVIGWSAHLLLSYELAMVDWFARLPFAAVHIGAFSGWWVVLFYAVLTVGYLFMKWRGRDLPERLPS